MNKITIMRILLVGIFILSLIQILDLKEGSEFFQKTPTITLAVSAGP